MQLKRGRDRVSGPEQDRRPRCLVETIAKARVDASKKTRQGASAISRAPRSFHSQGIGELQNREVLMRQPWGCRFERFRRSGLPPGCNLVPTRYRGISSRSALLNPRLLLETLRVSGGTAPSPPAALGREEFAQLGFRVLGKGFYKAASSLTGGVENSEAFHSVPGIHRSVIPPRLRKQTGSLSCSGP